MELTKQNIDYIKNILDKRGIKKVRKIVNIEKLPEDASCVVTLITGEIIKLNFSARWTPFMNGILHDSGMSLLNNYINNSKIIKISRDKYIPISQVANFSQLKRYANKRYVVSYKKSWFSPVKMEEIDVC